MRFKEMELVEWLKWYRLTISNILAEKNMVVGTGYFDVLEKDFYLAIHATYYAKALWTGLKIYKSQATRFKEMEIVEWLKWYRLTISNILAEKKMVVGTGYFDVLERDFYSAIHATYYGPEIHSMELLPKCFEAEERSSYETPEVLHLVSGHDLFGMVCLANKVPEISITNNEKSTSFKFFLSSPCQSIIDLNIHRNVERSNDFETHKGHCSKTSSIVSNAYRHLKLKVYILLQILNSNI
ncbi:hypothetical protein HKD37_03G007272 [Glycine soja]